MAHAKDLHRLRSCCVRKNMYEVEVGCSKVEIVSLPAHLRSFVQFRPRAAHFSIARRALDRGSTGASPCKASRRGHDKCFNTSKRKGCSEQGAQFNPCLKHVKFVVEPTPFGPGTKVWLFTMFCATLFCANHVKVIRRFEQMPAWRSAGTLSLHLLAH